MTNQSTEIQPIEAEEVELPAPDTAPVIVNPKQQQKERSERLKTVRMELHSMLPKPIQVWSKTAITAFVLAVLVFWTVGLTALPAIIFGHIGLIATRDRERGRWMAVTALVIGYATVFIFGSVVVFGLLFYYLG